MYNAVSFSSLTDSGRVVLNKLMYDNLEFYLAFGEIPSNYIDPWVIDADIPPYVAKLIQNEEVIRSSTSLIDYASYKDIRSIVQISSDAVSATGVLNNYINITAAPGIQGNIQVVITPGGFAGNETVNYTQGVLSLIIQNNATTRIQLANALKTSNLISDAVVMSGSNTPITIGVGTDNVFLVGGKDQTIYIENTDFTIGYLNNTGNLLLGSINWIGGRPLDGQTYKVTYWAKTLLSVQTDLIQVFGYKKAVSKNYVIEDVNGSITANGKKWSIVNTPSKHLTLLFLLENTDVPSGKVIRQYGVVVNVEVNPNSNPNDFLTPSELVNNGDLMIIQNNSPYRPEITSSTQLSVVISI